MNTVKTLTIGVVAALLLNIGLSSAADKLVASSGNNQTSQVESSMGCAVCQVDEN